MAYYVEYDERGKEVRIPKRGRPRRGWVEVTPGRFEQSSVSIKSNASRKQEVPDEIRKNLAELQKYLHPLRIERYNDKSLISFIGCDIISSSQDIQDLFQGQRSFSRIDVDLTTGTIKAWSIVGKGNPDIVLEKFLVEK